MRTMTVAGLKEILAEMQDEDLILMDTGNHAPLRAPHHIKGEAWVDDKFGFIETWAQSAPEGTKVHNVLVFD